MGIYEIARVATKLGHCITHVLDRAVTQERGPERW